MPGLKRETGLAHRQAGPIRQGGRTYAHDSCLNRSFQLVRGSGKGCQNWISQAYILRPGGKKEEGLMFRQARTGFGCLLTAALCVQLLPAVVYARDGAAQTRQSLKSQLAAMAKQFAALKKAQAVSNARQAALEKQVAALKVRSANAAASEGNRLGNAATSQAVQALYRRVMRITARQESLEKASATGKVNREIGTLFAARTQDRYFSQLNRENPAHIRPGMHMLIGRYEELRLYAGLQVESRFQALTQQNAFNNGFPLQQLNPGFQRPYGNLNFLATIPHKLDVFIEVYLESQKHPTYVYAGQGYVLLKALPAPLEHTPLGAVFHFINVKAGAFTIDFGDQNYHRSDNGYVQRNPLIGNALVDPSTEEIGTEVYSVKGPVRWLVGVGTGSTGDHFDYGGDPGVHGKIWGDPLPGLRLSASAYYADHAGQFNTPFFEVSGLYASNRTGGIYNAVFGGPPQNGFTTQPGQITPMEGLDVSAFQADITWTHWPIELYSNAGWTNDSAFRERWLYGQALGVYHITPALYLAAQYSYAIAGAVNGVDTAGWVDRFQVGGGYWITNNMLGKLEYVYEQYNNFGSAFSSAAGPVDGVDANFSPRFSGVVMEFSFGF